jgi:hypothetical protein
MKTGNVYLKMIQFLTTKHYRPGTAQPKKAVVRLQMRLVVPDHHILATMTVNTGAEANATQ